MKPSDFEISRILGDFIKLGTLVIFVDNSYTTNADGSDKSCLPTFDNGIFKVIDCNKPFPTKNSSLRGICTPINNIKVRNIYTGKIYHCSNLNIRSIEHGNNYGGEPSVKYKGKDQTIDSVFFTFPPHW